MVGGYLHVMYSNEIHPIAWTIPHCVLVLKLIGMYAYYSQKPQAFLAFVSFACVYPQDLPIVCTTVKRNRLEIYAKRFCE